MYSVTCVCHSLVVPTCRLSSRWLWSELMENISSELSSFGLIFMDPCVFSLCLFVAGSLCLPYLVLFFKHSIIVVCPDIWHLSYTVHSLWESINVIVNHLTIYVAISEKMWKKWNFWSWRVPHVGIYVPRCTLPAVKHGACWVPDVTEFVSEASFAYFDELQKRHYIFTCILPTFDYDWWHKTY